MTRTTTPICTHPDVDDCPCATPAPPDATKLHDWCGTPGLAVRSFVGTVRESGGFSICVEGVQRANGTASRHVAIDVSEPRCAVPFCGLVVLAPEAVRQLAAALTAAADEIDGGVK